MTTIDETVILKNGAKESKSLVATTMMILNRLMDEGKARVVCELIGLCKDTEYQPFNNIGDELEEMLLVTKRRETTNILGRHGVYWNVHSSTRNIVLSAIEGEGLGLRLVNPVRVSGDQLSK